MLLCESFPSDPELEAIAEPLHIHIPLHNPEVLIIDLERWGSRVGAVQNCVRFRFGEDIDMKYVMDFPMSRKFQSVC
jgi:hypothetical protein